MKNVFFGLLFLLSLRADGSIELFQNKFSGDIYQDIVIGSQIHLIGTDLCEPRYELIKPVLDQLNESFSVLDLGAAQGYFSFRIAQDFPKSSCLMIEANDTSYYSRHGDMLKELCVYNSDLSNLSYLNKRVDINDLEVIGHEKHFDVALAFLVVHLMHDSLDGQMKIIQSLLTLADNLILEVANDVGVIHTAYVEYLSEKLNCQYLGEVKRHKNQDSKSTGKLFWFKQKGA